MAVETIEQVTGAEAIDVYCDDLACHGKLGSKLLYTAHNGYSHNKDLKPLNGEQLSEAKKIAKQHDSRFNLLHSIRILIWRAR